MAGVRSLHRSPGRRRRAQGTAARRQRALRCPGRRRHLKLSRQTEWTRKYRWPISFFIAVGFWNLGGAGLLGFMINPPIALFYMQGLNTTAAHGHGAFFGVYGMLGLGLTLMCLRALQADREWK